jgi:hypothetical protein
MNDNSDYAERDHKENSKTWWIFHPFKGLDITDEFHDLDSPMFEDATIVSRKHSLQIVTTMMKIRENNQHEIINMLDPRFNWGEEYQSFIAVRRKGILEHNNHSSPLIIDSAARAQRISSLIGLVFLAENPRGETCCLVDQVHRRELRLAMIDIDESCFCYMGGDGSRSNTIFDSRRVQKLSRNDLRQTISKESFEALTSVLLPQKPSLPRSLHKAVEQSSIRLSDALHLASPSARLLGAVTSIEILISNHGDSYDLNLRRLAALLGDEAIEKYDAKSVLRARHLYVHKGEEIEDYGLPMNAIGLALSSLLRYAEIAQFSQNKTALLEYLDFLNSGRKLSTNWSNAERTKFSEFIKHKQESHNFPFLKDTS